MPGAAAASAEVDRPELLRPRHRAEHLQHARPPGTPGRQTPVQHGNAGNEAAAQDRICTIVQLALATDLPASVLADFTGTSISNATRWTGYAIRDWLDYIASRTQI